MRPLRQATVRRLAPCFLLAALLVGGSAGATPEFVTDSELRTVFVDAIASSGPQFSSQAEGDGSLGEFEDIDVDVASEAQTDGASADALADNASSISSSLFLATGSASASAAAEAEDGLASATADSLFDVIFQVSESGSFALSGLLFADASGEADAIAFLDLLDLDTPATLLSIEALPDDEVVIDEVVALMAGVDYQLVINATAFADALGAGSAFANAGFADVSFTVVPEPGSAALLLAGLAASAARRRPVRR